MKVFDWLLGKNHAYSIHVKRGHNGRWRWSIVDHKGKTIALSPVAGWSTFEHAAKRAREFLADIDADYLDISEDDEDV